MGWIVTELNGTTLEGGGQLLRVALCLSALTNHHIRIKDIRGKRSGGGGLKSQHLACVNWLGWATNALIEGAEPKSKTLTFKPGAGQSAEYNLLGNIGSPGSITLALQATLPFILFSSPEDVPWDTLDREPPVVHFTITGGTNVSGSPSFEYVEQVLFPTLVNIGFPSVKATLGRRGWSTGGSCIGSVVFEITPLNPGVRLPAFTLEPTGSDEVKLSRIDATILAPLAICTHFKNVVVIEIAKHHNGRCSEEAGTLKCSTEDSGSNKRLYLLLVATLTCGDKAYKLGRDCLYQQKIRSLEQAAAETAETVAAQLASDIRSGALVDEFMRDQLVIFQALAKGKSRVHVGQTEDGYPVPPTLHAQTAEWVVKEMLGDKIKIKSGAIRGMGFVSRDFSESTALDSF